MPMMNKTNFTELKSLFNLAIPLSLNLLAYMAMQLVDVIMIGRLGPLALASSAAGNVMYIIVLVGGIGIISAVGTLSAQAYGDKNTTKVSTIVQQGIWVVILLSIPALILIWSVPGFLLLIKQPVLVVQGARSFLHGLIFGYLPCILFVCLREFITAIGKPRIIITITVTAIPVNAVLNYILMYGKLGLPALGIFGVGLATSIVEWLILAAIVIYILRRPDFNLYQPFDIKKPNFKYIKSILKLGFPVGISFMVEEFMFVATALLMGYLGVNALAAHQIAVQCLYAVSMIPLGIGQAVAVRVGHALGAQELKQAKQIANLAIFAGMVIAFVVAAIFWLFPMQLASIFIDVNTQANIPVAALTVKLLIIIAVFHIIDASQIITNGALRGYQDTLIPMALGLISFWLFGISSGYVFAFILHYGAVGLWWGLALGISIAAVLLQLRLRTHRYKVKLLGSRL
jgi:MATE family multidrug resistance protein